MNTLKSYSIIFLFVLFITTIGFVLGKQFDLGMLAAFCTLGLTALLSIIGYMNAEKLIISGFRMRPLAKDSYHDLYTLTDELSRSMDIRSPDLLTIDDPSLNILTLGTSQKNAKLALTSGLIQNLSHSELEAVIAHELWHIKTGDTKLGTITTVFVGWLAALPLFSVLACLLLQIILSRKREFAADAEAVLITRYPDGLANALEKLGRETHVLDHANLATAHLFLINPLRFRMQNQLVSLANTHPPLRDRIKTLQSM